MTKKDFISFRTISIWLVVWGNLFWIVNHPLLVNGVYKSGSIGQSRILFISAFLSSLICWWILPKVVSNHIVASGPSIRIHKKD